MINIATGQQLYGEGLPGPPTQTQNAVRHHPLLVLMAPIMIMYMLLAAAGLSALPVMLV